MSNALLHITDNILIIVITMKTLTREKSHYLSSNSHIYLKQTQSFSIHISFVNKSIKCIIKAGFYNR